LDKININNEQVINPLYTITNGIRKDGQIILWNKSAEDDISWSSALSVINHFSKDIDFTLNVSRAFRSANLEERFQYIDQGNLVKIGNPDLKPEICNSADIGVRYGDETFYVSFNTFYYILNNLVTDVSGVWENRNALIKTNIGKAEMYGFDAKAEFIPVSSVKLYSTVSYVYGEDIKKNVPLPQIPPINGILGLEYSLIKNIESDFYMQIFNKQNRVALGEYKTTGYALFGVNILFKELKMGFVKYAVIIGSDNLLNKYYRNHLSTARGISSIEPGRNFFIKLNMDI